MNKCDYLTNESHPYPMNVISRAQTFFPNLYKKDVKFPMYYDQRRLRYTYMLFTGWEVRIDSYFVDISKTARGRRPTDVFETGTKYIFSIHADRPKW